MPDEDPKFLYIYYIGNKKEQVNIRCIYNHIEQNAIMESLDTFLYEKKLSVKQITKGQLHDRY